MKIKKFSLVLLLVICLITNLFVFRLQVFAEVSQDRIVQGHSGSFSQLDFNYVFHNKYFTVENAIGIPTSTVSNPVYYYTVDGVTFQSVNAADLVLLVYNRGLGLALSPDSAPDLVRAFLSSISRSMSSIYIQGALYDSSDNFLGYCLDDISGLYYASSPEAANDIVVPNETVNNVYNFYNYYKTVNPTPLDYFTFIVPTKDIILKNALPNHGPVSSGNWRDLVNSLDGTYSYYTNYQYDTNGKYYYYMYGSPIFNFSSDVFGVAVSASSFDAFVNSLNITSNEYSYLSFITYNWSDNSTSFNYYVYSSDGTNLNSCDSYTYVAGSGVFNSGTSNFSYLTFGHTGSTGLIVPFGKDITIYRNINVFNQINVNNNYTQNVITSDSFNNYSTSNDNSITTNVNQINNSSSSNTSIYNSTSSSFYNYVDNGTVDNSSYYSNNSTIINNYYSDNSGGGGDNPDNPDNPLDWSDLIELIKELLEAIGAVIVGIFEGLISMITQVLQAISNIISNLGGFTDFLSALFGFLPSPVPEVLAAGFSLCILCAVIKFLRG